MFRDCGEKWWFCLAMAGLRGIGSVDAQAGTGLAERVPRVRIAGGVVSLAWGRILLFGVAVGRNDGSGRESWAEERDGVQS